MYQQSLKTIFKTSISLFLTLLILTPVSVIAQNTLEDVGFSGQFFFSFEHDIFEDEVQSEFALKRGYITFRRVISENVQVRFTQDVSIDRQGDGIGDIELRLKYALVNYAIGDLGLLTNSNVEFGVVNRPWINFEQDVNDFRSQKSMFLDQNNILSSADYGVTFESGLGENLDAESQSGLKSNPGRYGSFSIGIYNGGGYSSLENNNNKVVESRLSIRLLHDALPGFQSSLIGLLGKGNIPESPDFRLGGLAFSYESETCNIVAQGFRGVGDGDGRFLDPQNLNAVSLRGWSAFFDIRPFVFPLSISFRFDELYNSDQNRYINRQLIAGLAYIFSNRSKLIFDISNREFHESMNTPDFTRIELVAEVRF